MREERDGRDEEPLDLGAIAEPRLRKACRLVSNEDDFDEEMDRKELLSAAGGAQTCTQLFPMHAALQEHTRASVLVGLNFSSSRRACKRFADCC